MKNLLLLLCLLGAPAIVGAEDNLSDEEQVDDQNDLNNQDEDEDDEGKWFRKLHEIPLEKALEIHPSKIHRGEIMNFDVRISSPGPILVDINKYNEMNCIISDNLYFKTADGNLLMIPVIQIKPHTKHLLVNPLDYLWEAYRLEILQAIILMRDNKDDSLAPFETRDCYVKNGLTERYRLSKNSFPYVKPLKLKPIEVQEQYSLAYVQ